MSLTSAELQQAYEELCAALRGQGFTSRVRNCRKGLRASFLRHRRLFATVYLYSTGTTVLELHLRGPVIMVARGGRRAALVAAILNHNSEGG